jgi:hypothetical protein
MLNPLKAFVLHEIHSVGYKFGPHKTVKSDDSSLNHRFVGQILAQGTQISL